MTHSEKTWRKSSYTAPDNNCVELTVRAHETAVRDSKAPGAGTFFVAASTWTKFLTYTKSDGFLQS